MWSSTWPRPAREERSMTQIDELASDIVARAFASRNIVEDMSSRKIYAVIFDMEVPREGDDPLYAYHFWLDGLDETLPGLTPGNVVPGFCSSLVGTQPGLAVGDPQATITIEDVATLLGQKFGHAPIAIRQYAVVAPEPGGAELVPED